MFNVHGATPIFAKEEFACAVGVELRGDAVTNSSRIYSECLGELRRAQL